MATYEFVVEEVRRDGFIAHDAVEVSTGKRLPLGPSAPTGTYPEISAELTSRLARAVEIEYRPHGGDTFDQATQVWTYHRAPDLIVVRDKIRTVMRVDGLSPPTGG